MSKCYTATLTIMDDERTYPTKEEFQNCLLDKVSEFIGETAYAHLKVEEYEDEGGIDDR